MQPVHRSLLELNASLVLLALVPLFAKWVALDAASIVFYRCLFGAIALWAFLCWRRTPLRLARRRDYPIVLLVGALLAVHWVTYFHAIQISTVAVAITAIFTYPALTVLLEPLFAGGRPRPLDLLLALVALCGVGLIVPAFTLADQVAAGVFWGVLSALLFALRNVMHRHWLRAYPSSQMMFYQLSIVGLLLLPVAAAPAQVAAVDWLLLVPLGIVFTALGHSLFVGSMRNLRAKTASLIACLQPVYAIMAAALLLAEYPEPRTLLGALLVLSVAVVESRRAPVS